METNKNLDDLIINLKPKVIRFTGEKFPTELWNNSFQITKKLYQIIYLRVNIAAVACIKKKFLIL